LPFCSTSDAQQHGKGRKKPDEELAYEVLNHLYQMTRTLYSSVAKAVHAQARRREDAAPQPNINMKAAAYALATLLRRNLLDDAHQVLPCAARLVSMLCARIPNSPAVTELTC
jgi:hypothetical protein